MMEEKGSSNKNRIDQVSSKFKVYSMARKDFCSVFANFYFDKKGETIHITFIGFIS